MTSNPELVEDVRQAFKNSSKEDWLVEVNDSGLTGTVEAEFKLESSNTTPWTEMRKRGIIPTSMHVKDRETVRAFLTRAEEVQTVVDTVQEEKECDCCGQTIEEETTTERTEIRTESTRL